jgi:hypothetical protein
MYPGGAGMTKRVVVPVRQAGNRFLGSFKCVQIRALEVNEKSTNKHIDSFLIFKIALSIEEQKWTLATFFKIIGRRNPGNFGSDLKMDL